MPYWWKRKLKLAQLHLVCKHPRLLLHLAEGDAAAEVEWDVVDDEDNHSIIIIMIIIIANPWEIHTSIPIYIYDIFSCTTTTTTTIQHTTFHILCVGGPTKELHTSIIIIIIVKEQSINQIKKIFTFFKNQQFFRITTILLIH